MSSWSSSSVNPPLSSTRRSTCTVSGSISAHLKPYLWSTSSTGPPASRPHVARLGVLCRNSPDESRTSVRGGGIMR
jgi:hypothetical protein